MERPYLIISDVHGDSDAMHRLREAERHFEARGILSAGDLCPDPYDYSFSGIQGVRGNTDRFYEYGDIPFPPLVYRTRLFGRDTVITHGDRMWVDDFEMEEGGIFISGHTHVPGIRKEKGIYLFNPGSASRPRSSSGPTAGLLGEDYLAFFSLVDFTLISSLAFSTEKIS
ncbi:MAG: metallophosphoesterase family protein [Spirochaetales bacterium]|nr:metallophosphoesterase family protein [Candidatus Physcosoma equi]